MAYVDLNPIRAGIANTPEDSEFTSTCERIKHLSSRRSVSIPLRLFSDQTENKEQSLPYSLRDYLMLVDCSGRLIRDDKRGAIDPELPSILNHAAQKAFYVILADARA